MVVSPVLGETTSRFASAASLTFTLAILALMSNSRVIAALRYPHAEPVHWHYFISLII